MKISNFFPWLRWIFSKRFKYDTENIKFEGVRPNSFFTQNGVFYSNNIRYSVKDCEFIPYKEPEPNVVKVEIDMGGYDSIFNNCYVGKLKLENNPELEPIIVHPGGDYPFTIVSVPEKPLTEEDRLDRFCDAVVDWNKRMERYDIHNMNVDVDKICKDKK